MGVRIPAREIAEKALIDTYLQKQTRSLEGIAARASERLEQAMGNAFDFNQQRLRQQEQDTLARLQQAFDTAAQGIHAQLRDAVLEGLALLFKSMPMRNFVDEALVQSRRDGVADVEVLLKMPQTWESPESAHVLTELAAIWPGLRLEWIANKWPLVETTVTGRTAVVDFGRIERSLDGKMEPAPFVP